MSHVADGIVFIRGAYKHKFFIHEKTKSGAAIAILGALKHFGSTPGLPIGENALFKEYFATQSIEWYRHARQDRQYCLNNGDLILITDTYKAAGWGFLAYHGPATTQNFEATFYQGTNGLYGWKYSPLLKNCKSKQYQKPLVPNAGPDPFDQCIGFRGYAIRCSPDAWNSLSD